jgi:signal peptidase II
MQAARGTPLTGPGAPAGDGQPERPADSDEPGRAATRPQIGVLVAAAVTVLVLDIVSKITVVATLSGHAPVRLLGGFLTLLVARNPGAAFSIGTSMTIVFTAIAVTVIVVILRTSRRIRSIPWAVTLGLLLGGATGNLLDRIFRSPGLFRGYVVDWIELPHWPVFNLADSAIVCGGVLAVLLSTRGTRLDGLRTPPGDGDQPDPPAPGEIPQSRNEALPASRPEQAGADTEQATGAPRAGDQQPGESVGGDR